MAASRAKARRPTPKKPRAFVLLVELEGARPRIWRRLLVPAHCSLADLHAILQLSMGWYDGHLHAFKVGERLFEDASQPDDEFGRKAEDEAKATLASLRLHQGSSFQYDYDFGDSWRLALTVEDEAEQEGQDFPLCLAGGRAGPLEDCGGLPGLDDLLDALDDPRHERHEELSGWVPIGYDPGAFSVAALNSALIWYFLRR
jgi:hypothetical protein